MYTTKSIQEDWLAGWIDVRADLKDQESIIPTKTERRFE